MNVIIETSDATTALPIALANVKWRDVSDQQVSGHVVLFSQYCLLSFRYF